MEATKRNLDLERLETRERQVTQAEDSVDAREARIQEEIDRCVAYPRAGLERRYEERLGLIKAETTGRTAALRTRLTEATQRAEAIAVALSSRRLSWPPPALNCFFFNGGLIMPRPSRSGMRTRSASGRRWNTCMAPCSVHSGKGLTWPWATSARQSLRSRM